MPNAEFGIIDEINLEKDYSDYEPEKYNCISIDDDYIGDWWNKLLLIKTYFHNAKCPNTALARWGVTLIPPESLPMLLDIIISDKRIYNDENLVLLVQMINVAIKNNKFMIHYGV